MLYPLSRYGAKNGKEETRILEEVASIIYRRKKMGKPIAGIIIEPVQAEGGDRQAMDVFYRRLRQLCLDEEVNY
jgi:4-aminobutyrate aminotransferase/(S)-3-amino-2-methylpropionate transaminase